MKIVKKYNENVITDHMSVEEVLDHAMCELIDVDPIKTDRHLWNAVNFLMAAIEKIDNNKFNS